MAEAPDDAALDVRLDWPSDVAGEAAARSRRGRPTPPLLGRHLPAPPPAIVPRPSAGEVERAPMAPVPVPAALDELRDRVEALSHASLAMHSVVVDRLAQHGDHLDGLVTDLRQGLDRQWEILEGLPAVIAGLQEQQVRFGAAIDRLERHSRRPDPGARVDGLVTGLVRGWDRFRELRGRRLT